MSAPDDGQPASKHDVERVVELISRLHEDLDRRFEAVQRRLDRLGEAVAGIQIQLGGLTRWSENLDRSHVEIQATQAAQQRAIDDLAERVARLEQRQSA